MALEQWLPKRTFCKYKIIPEKTAFVKNRCEIQTAGAMYKHGTYFC
jgi:hypothetical protein